MISADQITVLDEEDSTYFNVGAFFCGPGLLTVPLGLALAVGVDPTGYL
jgi:hypothetical protein